MTIEDLVELTKEVCVDSADRKMVEQMIVAWRKARSIRLEHDRLSRVEQAKETALKSYVIEVMRTQELEGMLIEGRLSGLTTNEVPTVSNKEEFIKYILAEQAIDLLQFRLAVGAVNARLNAGIQVPGVEKIDVYDLTDKKV